MIAGAIILVWLGNQFPLGMVVGRWLANLSGTGETLSRPCADDCTGSVEWTGAPRAPVVSYADDSLLHEVK